MSKSVSRTQPVAYEPCDGTVNSMALASKVGMKFPIGGDTYVTITAGKTKPSVEISSYENFKTAAGYHVIIPKRSGAVLTPKQFTRLLKNGPLIRSAIDSQLIKNETLMRSIINSSTHQNIVSNTRRPNSIIRQVRSNNRQTKRKNSTQKDNGDVEHTLYAPQPRRRVGRPAKCHQNRDLSKRDACTQTAAKRQLTSTDDGESLMCVMTDVEKVLNPEIV